MNTPANDTVHAPKRVASVTIWEIREKDTTRFGVKREGQIVKGHHAEVIVGKRVRLFGMIDGGQRYVKDPTGRMVPNDPQVYRRDFGVGDAASYGSYNLIYTGVIRGITAKTITVVENEGTNNERVHRMALVDFDRKNWNFDAEDAARSNADTMQYI